MITNELQNQGIFIGTTQLFDPETIDNIDVNSEQFKQLIHNLYTNVNNIILALNQKPNGIILNIETLSGKFYYNPNSNDPQKLRPSYIKIVDCGTLPDNTTTQTAHAIDWDENYTFISISGAATNPTGLESVPLPNSDITVSVDSDEILITTTTDFSDFTRTYITLEYIKIS